MKIKHLKRVLLFLSILAFLLIIIEWRSQSKQVSQLKVTISTKNNNITTRYVVMSCTITNQQQHNASKINHYCFYLPITIHFWKRLGYKALVIVSITNGVELNAYDRIFFNYLNQIDDILVFNITSPNDAATVIVSTIGRVFAAGLKHNDLINDDFLLTSDSDLLPIDSRYYFFTNLSHIYILNAFCCGEFKHLNRFYQIYPIGHIGMPIKLWKKVMDIDEDFKFNSENIVNVTEYSLGLDLNLSNYIFNKTSEFWQLDQKLISFRVEEYVEKMMIHKIFHKSAFAGLRLDRSNSLEKWANINANNVLIYTDSHLFDSNVLEKWYLVLRLVKVLLNQDHVRHIESYVNEYMNVYSHINKS